jgi:hypothetical protein
VAKKMVSIKKTIKERNKYTLNGSLRVYNAAEKE